LNCSHAIHLLADSIDFASIKYDFEVWAYVFMPEHVHLLIFPYADKYSISAILKAMKQSVSQSYVAWCSENRKEVLDKLRTGLVAPKYRFWKKGGGYDRNYWNRDEIVKLVDYIHMNPVKSGLVKNPEDWEWSSAGFWMSGKQGRVKCETKYFPYT
jgi:putative transposase